MKKECNLLLDITLVNVGKKHTSRSLKIVQYQQPGEFEESLRIITLIYWTKMIKISTLRKPAQRSSPSRVKCSFVLYNIDS